MRRRTLLASLGTTVLAGCNGSNAGSGSDSTPTATPTRTVGKTPTATFPFEFTGVDAPETVQLNVPFTFAVGVRNAGERERTFVSKLSLKVDDGEWRTASGQMQMTLSPGEKGVWKSPRGIPRYLGTYHYRLEAFDETWQTEIVPKKLDFSKRYATPKGLYVNVLGGRFESQYPTPGGSNDTSATSVSAPEGKVWLLLRVEVRNSTQSPMKSPPAEEFVVHVGGESYHPDYQEVTDDPYERMELGARTVTRGDLVYAVPKGTTAKDLTVTWAESLPGGDVKAVWSK
ncbi:MAG: hypothetical protein ABEJ82_05045 [Haloplanus sp.]